MTERNNALAPFVERALDRRGQVEALGVPECHGDEPRADAARTGWGAADHAASRLD